MFPRTWTLPAGILKVKTLDYKLIINLQLRWEKVTPSKDFGGKVRTILVFTYQSRFHKSNWTDKWENILNLYANFLT